MRIKDEDIRGYHIDGEDVCVECVSEQELRDITPNEIITERQVENFEGQWWCDRCAPKHRL